MHVRGVDDIQAVEEQAALLRVALLVARDTPLDQLFAAVAAESARVLGIDAAGVVRYVGEERGVVVGTFRPSGQRAFPVNAELDFHRADSALGLARTTRRPARIAYDSARGELAEVMKSMGMRAAVAAPVLVGDQVWGALAASALDEESLSPGIERRLTPLADLVGQALSNSEARAELAASRTRMVAAFDETRRRLERELHEGAQQHVVALALKLRVALSRAAPASGDAEVLRDLLADAMEASAELSEIARKLHPAVLTERGLAASLQALAARAALPIHLRALPGRRYTDVIEMTAYLAVVELLANAARHAHATECSLLASDDGDRLVIEVRDNGIGGAVMRPGSGLEWMADRGGALGARFALESPSGGGTSVRLEFPV